MSVDDKHLDDEVAKLTDTVLAHRTGASSESAMSYEQVIRQLQELIEPDIPAPTSLRERLAERLNDEWTVVRPRKKRQTYYLNRPLRIAVLAASVAIVLLATVLLLNKGNETPANVTGTAIGDGAGVIIVITAIIGGIVGFALWRRRR